MPIRDLLMSAGGAGSPPVYVEDVFSTYLYTGTGATQSINNGIDLATKGGLTWIKSRSAATNNNLFDTVQGATKLTHSNTTAATITDANSLTAFNSNGFTLGTGNTSGNQVNTSAATYASWSFRKQPKFFDVVTYTGTGANRTISHSLGSVPGMIIVKRTDTTAAWQVYHSSLANTEYLVLNSFAASATGATRWNSTTATSSVFSVGTDTTVNASGGTYVAYLFADNAGGFGATGTDNVISCGSFTSDSSAKATINLGYEPQYVLIKRTDTTGDWILLDVMREFSLTNDNLLYANTSGTEDPALIAWPTATGFQFYWQPSGTYIYMAIRRPMKVPTDATTVFKPVLQNCNPSAPSTVTTGFPVDLSLGFVNSGATYTAAADRLRGSSVSYQNLLYTQTTNAEDIYSNYGIGLDSNTTIQDYHYGIAVGSALPTSYWSFKRAPGFFDVVCYTGTGANTTVAHNLTVVPEMMIVKGRSNVYNWSVYTTTTGITNYLRLNTVNASASASNVLWNDTLPTSSVFSVGISPQINGSGATYVAYLFATCAGVSKVGSYTGNGTTQAIACGFTGGARFVLIKRTDSTGDWYVYDTARGMTTLTDPYLLLNSTATEVATLGSVTTTTGGFTVNATILAAINTNAATYIFLAIS